MAKRIRFANGPGGQGNKLETWFIWSVDWSRLAALLLVDGRACAALMVVAGWRRRV